MAVRLKNTLQFTDLESGQTITLPHGLSTGQRAIAPDIVFVPFGQIDVETNDTDVILTNRGPLVSGTVLVEAWHTIERAFGGNQNVNLSVKPYIVREAPTTTIWPPFPDTYPVEVVIYVRTTGDDDTGNGTFDNPYRTFRRAIRDVPPQIAPGYFYTIDVTGIGVETFPPNYQFPPVAAPIKNTYSVDGGGLCPYPFNIGSSFNIRAFPQAATSGPSGPIPPSETLVPAADYSVAFDPVSKLGVVTTLTARASWAADNLKGKFCLQDTNSGGSCAISGSDATHLYVCADAVHFLAGLDLSIVEPSATFEGTYNSQSDLGAIEVINCPYVAFQGIAFRALDPDGFGDGSLAIEYAWGPQPNMSLCDIEGIAVIGVTTNFSMFACTIRNKNAEFDAGEFSVYQCLLLDIPEFFIAGTNGNVTVRSTFDGCPALTGGIFYTTLGNYPNLGWQVAKCEFKNCTDSHGVIWALGGDTFTLQDVKLDNPVGPGVHAEGSAASVVLENVGGTASTYGVHVEDGSTVRVLDNATVITGTTGDMKVGTLATRTWANFRGSPPVKNQYDIVSPPVGDETTGAGTGGTSGSRLFQRPV